MVKFSRELRRILVVWLTLFLASIGLGFRVYHLQIVNGEELRQKAESQQQISLKPYVPRRSIIDRTGNVLATDRVIYELYAHPKLFTESQEIIAQDLAAILNQTTPRELLNQFQQQASGIRLEDNLTEELAEQVEELQHNGLELIQKYARYYPHKELGANIVGYVQKDDHQGKTGVEFTQQEHLVREATSLLAIQRTGRGGIIPVYFPQQGVNFDAKKLQVTIDLRLQRIAHEALKKQIKAFNAKRGTVIVMDVNTGELLSLVSEPTYDPNKYFNYEWEDMKNWAITDLYEPGSTFKPINIAIALEAGLITPYTEIYDPGKMKVGGWTIRNHDYFSNGGHGTINLAEILQVSSNIGMIKIMQRMSPQDYYNKLLQLELEERVGIDLIGETPGYIKPEFQFTNYPIEPATASFGQGFSLTPIKLAQLHASLANGGYLVTPHVVKGFVSQDGETIEIKQHSKKQVFSSQTTKEVLAMMETVVSEGSGKSSKILGYRLGGKTGTAQKASPRGYYTNDKITSFVGVFPANNPRYVVLAVVDEPKKPLAYGSTVAAPIVKEVLEGLILIEGIPPSHPEDFEKEEEKKQKN